MCTTGLIAVSVQEIAPEDHVIAAGSPPSSHHLSTFTWHVSPLFAAFDLIWRKQRKYSTLIGSIKPVPRRGDRGLMIIGRSLLERGIKIWKPCKQGKTHLECYVDCKRKKNFFHAVSNFSGDLQGRAHFFGIHQSPIKSLPIMNPLYAQKCPNPLNYWAPLPLSKLLSRKGTAAD